MFCQFIYSMMGSVGKKEGGCELTERRLRSLTTEAGRDVGS